MARQPTWMGSQPANAAVQFHERFVCLAAGLPDRVHLQDQPDHESRLTDQGERQAQIPKELVARERTLRQQPATANEDCQPERQDDPRADHRTETRAPRPTPGWFRHHRDGFGRIEAQRRPAPDTQQLFGAVKLGVEHARVHSRRLEGRSTSARRLGFETTCRRPNGPAVDSPRARKAWARDA